MTTLRVLLRNLCAARTIAPTHTGDIDQSVNIMTWNIRHGGGDRVDGIVRYLFNQRPDIVVLTEYRPHRVSGARLREALGDAGWLYLEESPYSGDDNAILIASRTPLLRVDSRLAVDMPADVERVMQARWIEVQAPAYTLTGHKPHMAPMPLTIGGVHVPGIDNKLGRKGKHIFWQALLDMATSRADEAMLMVGDFNTGLTLDEGGPTPFDCKEYMTRLSDELGWQDAWRCYHGAIREYTWYSSKGGGYRLDYGWLSPLLRGSLREAVHHHDVRTVLQLSDHAALSVALAADAA